MNEELFRRIASEYADQSGAELRRELDALDQSGITQLTPALDKRVFSQIRVQKRRRYRRIGGLVAACIALALLAPIALRLAERESAPTADISSGSPASPTVSASAQPTPSAAAPSPQYEIIPLAATLPERFAISVVEQDVEKTVYYIKDALLDDIVMTLQLADDLEMLRELSPVTIGAYTAYGRVEPGYRLLAFEHDGVLYVLTCEYDINTLVELARNILI